jgi:hypothetical protein
LAAPAPVPQSDGGLGATTTASRSRDSSASSSSSSDVFVSASLDKTHFLGPVAAALFAPTAETVARGAREIDADAPGVHVGLVAEICKLTKRKQNKNKSSQENEKAECRQIRHCKSLPLVFSHS